MNIERRKPSARTEYENDLDQERRIRAGRQVRPGLDTLRRRGPGPGAARQQDRHGAARQDQAHFHPPSGYRGIRRGGERGEGETFRQQAQE